MKGRFFLIVVTALALPLLLGTSLAFANPDNPLASPFKGVAIALGQASTAPVELIENIRGVVAKYERNTISTLLQSMRVIENLSEVPIVTVATNDMAAFPSPEHPLYPDYLDKRFSQFKYTVDRDGFVTVDTSWATTDAFLAKIQRWLKEAKSEQ